MEVIVNGAPQRIDPATSLARLLQMLELGSGRIAVEVNGEIVPRSQFDNCALQDNDRIEIVQAIGGG